MLNLGKVKIRGVDISTETMINPWKDLFITMKVQYTYQKAQDYTDPSDNYYKDQIPYIPWHSGSAIAQASYKGWDLNYSFIYVGERIQNEIWFTESIFGGQQLVESRL